MRERAEGALETARVPFPMATEAQAARARAMAVWGREAVYVEAIRVQVLVLVATQADISEERIDELRAAQERAGHVVAALNRIDVAYIDGLYVVVDGHHRATLAHRRQDEWISARVYRSVANGAKVLCDFHYGSTTCPCAVTKAARERW